MAGKTPQSRIGFIGLGVMGEAVCRNLARTAARRITAYDQREAPLQRLGADGVETAASVAAVAAGSDALLLCLPGEPQVEAVCYGPDGVLAQAAAGTLIVDLGTTPFDTTQKLAREAAARGLRFADAPMARGRQAARDGTLSLTVGCAEPLFDDVRTLLADAAEEITWCGPPGCGQLAKILNNMVLFETVQALAEALTVARACGMEGAKLFECLMKGSADSFALRNHGLRALLPGDFPTEAFPVIYALKDIDYALRLGDETATPLDGARATRARLELAARQGHGDRYFPVLLQTLAPYGGPARGPSKESGEG